MRHDSGAMRHVRKPVGGTEAPTLKVAFVLADRFTLSAFAGFVDVLRLAADEGDRSRPDPIERARRSTVRHRRRS